MSDIATKARLAPSISRFPVEWYFDEKLFELEKQLIFDAGPGYAGHELMVPELYNYRSTEWSDHAHLLVRQPDGVYRMSNVCRHRQAIMLQGSGTAQADLAGMNVAGEFYYPEDIALLEPEFIKAEQAAYMETALEDDDIGERMDRGRHALLRQGRSEVGPYQSPMEDGMQHFHEFYRRTMRAHPESAAALSPQGAKKLLERSGEFLDEALATR